MTPGARVAAAIEVLDKVLAGMAAEQALTGWARGARYAGSKDRAAVRDHVFQALRCKRSYAALGGAETGRGLMLGQLRDQDIAVDMLFSGEGHAPPALNTQERSAGHAPIGTALYDLPDWLWPHFEAALGPAGARDAANILRTRAPVALRVNLRKSSVPEAIETLAKDGIETKAVQDVDTAVLVIDGARRVARSSAYLDGLVELQDVSSQAAMAALPVPPDGRLLDYCVGGGGKVLALAARHDGHWFAHDAAQDRMRDLPARATRAGARVARLSQAELASHGPFDVVLCDVPCSGSGTWRRSPDAKWRLTPKRLDDLQVLQQNILQDAMQLVRSGGAVAYATCSVFCMENEDQISDFSSKNPEWQVESKLRWPISETGDGFFLSVMRAPLRL